MIGAVIVPAVLGLAFPARTNDRSRSTSTWSTSMAEVTRRYLVTSGSLAEAKFQAATVN